MSQSLRCAESKRSVNLSTSQPFDTLYGEMFQTFNDFVFLHNETDGFISRSGEME